ncbi:MAG TPA: NAD(+)/NADH kinase, partial [Candidatus Pacearchaeota archaeon]|nr:NAD(+)/NADH kinase [Candidatus Pacearchaeota archaeon]
MFRNIVLVYKTKLKNHLFEKIEDIKDNFPNSNFIAIEYSSVKKELLQDADLVLTLGGDGTFVKAANLIEDSFILGINAEPNQSEGALTSLNINEIDKLKEIETSKFQVIKMQRAKIILNKKVLDEN